MPLLVALTIVAVGVWAPVSAAHWRETPQAAGSFTDERRPPLLAYYYIWFEPRSWERAKTDFPVLGRYSSDDRAVMEQHVRWAKAAGIDGFIVSWKNTEPLSRRLTLLATVANESDFKLVIIYQGLDFERRPLPVARIAADLDYFADTHARDPAFDLFGRPVVIWSGTWEFSREEIEQVTAARRDRLAILASERNVRDYVGKVDLVDGNAYYWSSVNPDTYPGYPEKLRAMAETVHANGGLWIAPAAPGFDARLIGGERIVDRQGGETLRRQMTAALASAPDAIGLISWNEFSENSHVEPSCAHGTRALEVVAEIRGGASAETSLPGDVAANCAAQAEAGPVNTPTVAPTASATPVEPDAPVAGSARFEGSDLDSSSPAGTDRNISRFACIGSMVLVTVVCLSVVARRASRQADEIEPSADAAAPPAEVAESP